MDDHDEVRDAFEGLRESVEPTVDAEAHLSALHSVRTPTRVHSRRGPWIAAAAAVVILGVGAGTLALRPEGDSTRIDATNGSSSPLGAASEPDEARCGAGGAYVYLEHTADEAQVEAVRSRIERLGDSQEIWYLDQEATFEEFSRLFADQPQFVDAISPEELPTSFRVRPTEPWTAAEIESIEAHADVLRVEFTREYCEESRAPATPPNDASITTSTLPAAPERNGTSNPGRIWQHAASEDGVEFLAAVGGVLAYDPTHDCFLLESGGRRHPVIWPSGTTAVAGPAVRLRNGPTVQLGDSVAGGGGQSAPGPGEFDIPAECLPDTGEAISFNPNETLSVTTNNDPDQPR